MRFDDPIAILGYVLLAVFWIVVSMLGWFSVRCFRSRRYVLGSVPSLLIFGMLWGGLYAGATPGSAAFHRYHFLTPALFGRKFYLPAPRFSYIDPGLIERYSIDVFDLPDSVVKWMTAPPPEFTTDYPTPWPNADAHWKRVAWHPTPAGREYDKVLSHLGGVVDDSEAEPGWHEVVKANELRQQLMAEPGNYFALRYYEDGPQLDQVSFEVISPSRRLLISGFHP